MLRLPQGQAGGGFNRFAQAAGPGNVREGPGALYGFLCDSVEFEVSSYLVCVSATGLQSVSTHIEEFIVRSLQRCVCCKNVRSLLKEVCCKKLVV